MTITTITIATVNYVAYASVAEADPYLAVDLTRAATWAALATDDIKGARLVQATRRFDLLSWQGEKTVASQANDWPRTGVVDENGDAVSTTEVPQALEDATIILAADITIRATEGDPGTTGSNIKRARAGSAEVEYHRPTVGNPLPNFAFELIRQFLSGQVEGAGVGMLANGTDEVSSFRNAAGDDVRRYGLTGGLS